MKKIIKKFGNSLVIVFNKEDCEVYDLEANDIIELELVHVKGGKD